MICNVDALNERAPRRAHAPSVCVKQLIKMCNRFTDPDMPLEQKVIIHTVWCSLILTSGKILERARWN